MKKKIANKKKKKNGFTLVELLAIVVIISVILGVGSYFIGNVVDNAKTEVSYVNESSVLASAKLYLKEEPSEVVWNINEEIGSGVAYIPVIGLVNKGFLEKDKALEVYDKCVVMTKNLENDTIIYEKIVACGGEGKTLAKIPTAGEKCSNPTYNGNTHTIVTSADEGYTFEGDAGKINAGSYKVSAKLNEGYIWEDGTTDDKEITCKIKKATPTLEVVNASGVNGEEGTSLGASKLVLTSTVSGKLKIKSSNSSYVTAKVDDDTVSEPELKKDITVNILALRETSTIITFTLTPDDDNYKKASVTYTVGKVENREVVKPDCISEEIEYNGEDVILMSENEGYTLLNNVVSSVGEYTVTAKLNYGYVWKDDDNTDDVVRTCQVVNKEFKVTLDNQGATTASVPTEMTVYYDTLVSNLTSVPERKHNVVFEYTEPITDTNLSPSTVTETVVYKYSFKGFYTGKNGTGTKYIDENGIGVKKWDITEDRTLYAYWEKSSLTAPSVSIPSGYDSIYWTATNDKTASHITVTSYHPTSNVVLYGHILDTTAPQCDISASGTQKISSISDWYSSNVTLKYTCSDLGSGCVANEEDVFNGITLSTEGKHEYNDIVVKDRAGNSANCTNKTIKIDKTPPVITATKGTPNTAANSAFKTGTDGTITDSVSEIIKVSHSSCADMGSTNAQYCSYSSGGVTYSAVNRLANYLNGTTLSGDLKSTDGDYCQLTSPKASHNYHHDLSWNVMQLIMFAQDAAGNSSALLIKQNVSSGTFTTTNVSSYFKYYDVCRPLP